MTSPLAVRLLRWFWYATIVTAVYSALKEAGASANLWRMPLESHWETAWLYAANAVGAYSLAKWKNWI